MENIITLTDEQIKISEKIILCSVVSYLRVHPIGITTSEWDRIFSFFGVYTAAKQVIIDNVSAEDEFLYSHACFNGEMFDLSERWLDYELFSCMLNYYFITVSVDGIILGYENADIIHNLQLYRSALHNINMMNVNSGAYECICNGSFSAAHAPQTFESFRPQDLIRILEMYSRKELNGDSKCIITLLYRIINYEISTHANAMYLIVSSQLLKRSTILRSEIREIADELYCNLHYLLQDARVISLETNRLFQELQKKYHERTKMADNTTRLHILYGFDNYDSYSLRLDLAHEGIGWMHFNNTTPGGTKSYFFKEDEHKQIVRDTPCMVKCFIHYGNRWFLKEKSNCDLSYDEEQQYGQIEIEKEHSKIFEGIYSEGNVMEFLEIFGNIIISLDSGNVDKDGENAKFCFNLDKLFCWVQFYLFSKIESDHACADKIADHIVNRAVSYGIINSHEKEIFQSEEGIELIIELASERCFPYK